MVILGAKMKVGQEDGSLGTRDDEDDKDEEEKAEHVIGLMRPNAVENEEELNEDAAEGEDAAHDDSRERARVDGLVGDLARDLVCPHGMLDRALLEAEIRADEGQRHGHTEPQCQQPHLERYKRRVVLMMMYFTIELKEEGATRRTERRGGKSDEEEEVTRTVKEWKKI